MDETLAKLLSNDMFSEETKKELSDVFRQSLEEAKVEQEKSLREEFATRFDTEKEKIAEAIQQYVDQKNEAEMTEFYADWKGVNEQRMKYVNAQATLKEHAKAAIAQRMQVFEKAIKRALMRETKELHEELKVNRTAAVRAITEAKAQAEADRQAFKTKGAKVLEHILQVQFDSKLRAMKEDIDKAKQNDFGSRIFEAFMGEARRLFFNSNKELRVLLKQMNEQQQAFAQMKADYEQQLYEARVSANTAINENRQIKESAIRHQKMNKLLNTVPVGIARERMKTLLEASNVKDMERTFQKYASEILTETTRPGTRKPADLTEHALTLRTGNGRQAIAEDDGDEAEFKQLRALAGIVRR